MGRIDQGVVSDLETFVAELAKLPLRFAPGERWEYSHGMDVIGRVLEVFISSFAGVCMRRREGRGDSEGTGATRR